MPYQPIPSSASFVTAAQATFQLDGVDIYPSGTSWRALCMHQWLAIDSIASAYQCDDHALRKDAWKALL